MGILSNILSQFCNDTETVDRDHLLQYFTGKLLCLYVFLCVYFQRHSFNILMILRTFIRLLSVSRKEPPTMFCLIM